jgi:radical SAM superfamily enzyme YgiQ (UPF0313 family)
MEILDFNLNRPTGEEATELIGQTGAVYVGITGMAIQWGLIREYARIAKRQLPGCTVIVGGRVTAVPGLVLNSPEVDYCVLYDGEDTVVELLDTLDKGFDPIKESVRGIACIRNGRAVITPERAFETNLDGYGPIDYSLWDVEQYIENQIRTVAHRGVYQRRSINMISTRGCPFRCSFCGEDRDSLRKRSIPSIFDEIDDVIRQYGVEHIHFSDGLFVNSRKRVIDFCKEYDLRGETFTWSGNGRVDITNEELLIRMKGSGCNQLGYGFESGSQKMLRAMNKTTRVEQNVKALELHRKHDVGISSSFIFGAPGESYRTMAKTALFMIKHNFKPSAINFMMVYPGTPDWYHALKTDAIMNPDSYMEAMAHEVGRMRYSEIKPLVNMTKMRDFTYFAWGKFLQVLIHVSLAFYRTWNYQKTHGPRKTVRRIFQALKTES